jgi:hypothetical protein
MSLLTRESFFATAPAFPSETVELDGMGAVVVRVMSAGDRDRWEAMLRKDIPADFRARLVVLTAFGDDGKPLFTPADVPQLSALPSTVLDPIVEAAARVNKMRPGDVEAEVKNSESAPDSDS